MKQGRPPAKRQKKTSPAIAQSAPLSIPSLANIANLEIQTGPIPIIWKASKHVLRSDDTYVRDCIYDRLMPNFAADFDMSAPKFDNLTHNGVLVQIHNAYRRCAEIREFVDIAYKTCFATHVEAYRDALDVRRRQLDSHPTSQHAPQKTHIAALDELLEEMMKDLSTGVLSLQRRDCIEYLRKHCLGKAAFDDCFAHGPFESEGQFKEIYEQAQCIQEACVDLCRVTI
jgi:hypothetical protein